EALACGAGADLLQQRAADAAPAIGRIHVHLRQVRGTVQGGVQRVAHRLTVGLRHPQAAAGGGLGMVVRVQGAAREYRVGLVPAKHLAGAPLDADQGRGIGGPAGAQRPAAHFGFFSGRFQPSTMDWRAREMVRVSAGALRVITEPAPIVAPGPISTGATSAELEPMKAPSPITVADLFAPS